MTPVGFTAYKSLRRYVLRCDDCGELRTVSRRNAPRARRWAKWHAREGECAKGANVGTTSSG